MSRRSRAAVVSMLLLLVAGLGCKEKEQAPITVGPDQLSLERERSQQLQSLLDRCNQERADDAAQMQAMRNEVEKLRQQLAARPEPEPPAPGWQAVPGGVMTSIEGTVLFDSGKAVLKAGAQKTLEQVAATVRDKYPNHDIYVFGHTDDTPIRKSGWKDNYELSAQRALSVVRVLREAGVKSSMAAAGWGELLPVAENISEQARQANRRVEIYAMAPESGYKALMKGTVKSPPPTGAGRQQAP